MRKLRVYTEMDPNTFEPVVKITSSDDGVGTLLFEGKLNPGRYTAAEQAKIDMFDKALRDNGLPIMTQEEADWSIGKPSLPEPSEEEIQRLAGFRVEKKIIKLD
jgi:hypothetical protein